MANKFLQFLKNYLLGISIIVAVVLSIVIGVIMRQFNTSYSPRTVMYVNFLGDLFLRMIRALILPLIISSLIAAIAPLDTSLSKRIGRRAILYILGTTILAVCLGVLLVTTIKPGKNPDVEKIETERNSFTIVDTLLDLIRNMFPVNVVQATLQSYKTVLIPLEDNPDAPMGDWRIGGTYIDGTNMLGVVSISIIVGITMGTIRKKVPTLLTTILEFTKVMMKLIQVIIWLTPVGVFFLILAKFLEIEDITGVFKQLGLYVAVCCGGNLFHGFVVLPLIYFIFTRNNPVKFIGNLAPAIITAFGTASSLATLPVNLKCCEENAKIDSRVTRFMLPLGATISMNGTGLYQSVASIFIAQMNDVDLSIGNVLAIVITATAASVGTAGVPQAGLITLIMVLDSIGIPAETISLIIAVDWIVGRVNTVVNIMGDAYGSAIVEKLSKKELEAIPKQLDENVISNGKQVAVVNHVDTKANDKMEDVRVAE